jgi:hypothetical protein
VPIWTGFASTIAPFGLSLAFYMRSSALAYTYYPYLLYSPPHNQYHNLKYTAFTPQNIFDAPGRDLQICIPGMRPCLTQRHVRYRDPAPW